MQINARVDYGLRAMLDLAAFDDPGLPIKSEEISERQEIPPKFLEGILAQLSKSGLVTSQRGASGGYHLARPSHEITVAEVFRVLDGPLAAVRGVSPEDARYSDEAAGLTRVWIAMRAALRQVLEEVTLADIGAGRFPDHISELLSEPGAWDRR